MKAVDYKHSNTVIFRQ